MFPLFNGFHVFCMNVSHDVIEFFLFTKGRSMVTSPRCLDDVFSMHAAATELETASNARVIDV